MNVNINVKKAVCVCVSIRICPLIFVYSNLLGLNNNYSKNCECEFKKKIFGIFSIFMFLGNWLFINKKHKGEEKNYFKERKQKVIQHNFIIHIYCLNDF